MINTMFRTIALFDSSLLSTSQMVHSPMVSWKIKASNAVANTRIDTCMDLRLLSACRLRIFMLQKLRSADLVDCFGRHGEQHIVPILRLSLVLICPSAERKPWFPSYSLILGKRKQSPFLRKFTGASKPPCYIKELLEFELEVFRNGWICKKTARKYIKFMDHMANGEDKHDCALPSNTESSPLEFFEKYLKFPKPIHMLCQHCTTWIHRIPIVTRQIATPQ